MISCQVDTELLIHNPIVHLKIKMMIKTTALRILPILLNVGHLWNQIKDQLKVHNKNHYKPQNTSYPEIIAGQLQNPSVEMQQKISEVSSSEKTKTEQERL